MFWVILVAIVAIIVLYNVLAPRYKIVIAGSTSPVYEDANLKASFGFKKVENLRKLVLVPLEIRNKSTQPMQLQWDSSVFVSPEGHSCRIIHTGVRLMDRNASQPPTIIASNSKVSDVIIPSDNISWQTGVGDWKYSPLLKRWAGPESFTFKILLLMRVGNEDRPYEFEFHATKPKKG